ncbi:MAG: 5-(carboxyamino)imidazole ribonucleotide mutase [bacterium]|nr:5-(carboxyamino)imidazole ribonucleotide mutase [bacterium]
MFPCPPSLTTNLLISIFEKKLPKSQRGNLTMKPFVAIISGSRSDLNIVKKSGLIPTLQSRGIRIEFSIISAHRNPDDLTKYCHSALQRGAKVFIGIAGMAAALPGDIAARIKGKRPVIGVPLMAKDGFLNGLDAVLAMFRMPPGMPVAIAGIGKSGLENAAILAIQIMALIDPAVDAEMDEWARRSTKPAEVNIGLEELAKS